MPTARDVINSVRRPLEVAENAMLANNDAFAAVASIRAAQQAAAIAWMNCGGALAEAGVKSQLDEIVDRLSRMLTAEQKTGLEAAIQKIIDREEAFEHPELPTDEGGMCIGEPDCEGAGDGRTQEHDDACPAKAALQIHDYQEQIADLQYH